MTTEHDAAFEAALPEPLIFRTDDSGYHASDEPEYYTLDQMRAIWNARGEADARVWQPIETAPRDSSRILVAYNNASGGWRVVEAWWRMPYEAAPLHRCWWCHDGNTTLLDESVHGVGASHWMPLPEPPLSGG